MSFNRQTWYPAEQVQSSVLMQQEQDASRSLFQFIQDALGGTNAAFTGLAATPGTGLTVAIGDGALYQYSELDPTAWSTLPADTNEWMLQGLLRSSTTLSGFAAPGTSGDSIDYLIEAQIQVTDTTAVNLPFTNGANPPTTVYESKSPSRQNVIAFQVVAGTAAATGSQVAPSPTTGWVPLWLVTVAYGESQIVSGNITLAANAPQFTGFVHSNPNGETPVYLSSPTAQSGFIDITGNVTAGGVIVPTALLGGASATTHFDASFLNGLSGDYENLTAVGFTGSKQVTDSLNIAGSIGYTGTHAGTDADPYPLSMLNVAQLGGKVVSDFALASGNYITVYASTPTLATGNAGVTGYLEASTLESTVATGTAPLTVASTTEVANLNANYLQGFSAGNAAGNVAVSNGTLCANLNAQYLNGIASSGYQLAGNYAEMNVTNTGSFAASSTLSSTGGTSSSQIVAGYLTANAFGMNSGGTLAFVQGPSAPLGLLGTKVLTQGPLYVGGDAANQPVYSSDIIPSGLLRSGVCLYTATSLQGQNVYPYPGNGQAIGTYSSMNGQINFCCDTVDGQAFCVGFRVKITVNASLPLAWFGYGVAYGEIYVDGVAIGHAGNTVEGCSHTISAGTHTIDVVYNAADMGGPYYLGSQGVSNQWGGNFTLLGWLPFVNGVLSSTITAIEPG